MSVHVTGPECAVTFTGPDTLRVAAALDAYARANPRASVLRELAGEARRAAEGYAAEHRKMLADLRSSAGGGTDRFRKGADRAPSAPTEWITTEEAAQRLQVTSRYVRRLASQGRIKARRTAGRGAAWEIDAADVATWVPSLSA